MEKINGYLNQKRPKRSFKNLFICICYIILILFFIFPILWAISLATRTPEEIFSYPPSLIPSAPTLNNFIKVWEDGSIPMYLLNSLKLVILTIFGTLLITVPMGYSLSRFDFKNKKLLVFSILAFQMISPIIISIPIYVYFNRLGLLDSHTGLIFIYIAIQVPFSTWILKGFFDSIPIELEDAAKIDGCTRLQALRRVVLPLSLPGISTTIIFMGMGTWSQFILPFLLISRDNLLPISVGILMIQGSYQQISTHLIAAASVLAMLPPVVLVLVLQKFILKALMAGALKG